MGAMKLGTGSWNKKHIENLQLISLKVQVRNLESGDLLRYHQ